MIKYNDLQEQELTEKFDEKKAEKALKDMQVAFAQVKFVGIDNTIEKEFKQVYGRLASKWFGSTEMKRRGLSTELK